MKGCPTCGRQYEDTVKYCLDDGAELKRRVDLDAETRSLPRLIEVELSKIVDQILSHRDSVICNIWPPVRHAISNLDEGSYDSELLFSLIWVKIQESKNRLRGFVGKNSGKDICKFLEENFTQDDLKLIFDKAENNFLLSKDSPKQKYLKLRNYVVVKTHEVFSDLIEKLHDLEGG
jgi:hypothetical protein